ncbi:MAG: hypothetical protein AAGJ40_05700 [Planctomycetota bacterium]
MIDSLHSTFGSLRTISRLAIPLLLGIVSVSVHGQSSDPFGNPFLGGGSDPFSESTSSASGTANKPSTKEETTTRPSYERDDAAEERARKWAQQFDELARHRELQSKPAHELLQLTDQLFARLELTESELSERTRQFEQDEQSLLSTIEKLRDELAQARQGEYNLKTESETSRELRWELENQLRDLNRSVSQLVSWMVTALQDRGERDQARSILDLLERHEGMAELLVRATSSPIARRQSPLSVGLIRIANGAFGDDESSQVVRVLRRELPELAESEGLIGRVPVGWPIVAQSNRTAEQDILMRLDSTTSSMDWVDVPLEEVLADLGDGHSIPFLFDQVDFEDYALFSDVPITFRASALSVRSVLKQMLADQFMGFFVDGDCVKIVSEPTALAYRVQRIYDVGAILDSPNVNSMDELITAISTSSASENNDGDDRESRLDVVAVGKRVVVTANEAHHHRIAVLLRLLAS